MNDRRQTKSTRAGQRRGATYVVVVGAAMVVALMFLASVLSTRIVRRQLQDAQMAYQAELYAQSAIDMALYQIAVNPNKWRADMAKNTWATDQPIGWEDQPISQASYSFTAIDPVDGNLTNSEFDPIEIIGIGKRDRAVQKLRARLNIQLIGYPCMTSALHAGGDLVVNGATLTSDQWIASNNKVIAQSGAQVYADARSKVYPIYDAFSSYHKQTSSDGAWPRAMPPTPDVFDYYLANATPIHLTDLQVVDHDANQMLNWSAEAGLSSWSGDNCTLTIDTTIKKDGVQSLKASARSNYLSGPIQDVTPIIFSGGTYFLQADLYNPHASLTCDARLHLKVESTGEGVRYFSTPVKAIPKGKWGTVSGAVAPTYTGQLIRTSWLATLEHATEPVSNLNFNVDKAVLNDQSYSDGSYVFARKTLSPWLNPFGAGQTNSEGLYLLDCQGQEVFIENSRIVGTLMLVNSGSAQIRRSMNWEPYIFNFPAVLADNDLTIRTDMATLSEQTQRVNFNPASTPYEEVSDADQNDSYPSVIKGLIFADGELTFSGHPVLESIVMSSNDIIVNATGLNVTYRAASYEDAPPGFRGTPILKILPGTIQRKVF